MKVLVLNCGSSSIKCRLYDMPAKGLLAQAQVECIGEQSSVLQLQIGEHVDHHELVVADHEAGMSLILQQLVDDTPGTLSGIGQIAAVGHRVVHGGEAFTGSVLINDTVLATIEQCADLAPLHNPANLIGIRAARQTLVGVPHVACFDTAFHATIPQQAHLYALPYELYTQFRIRRYGFHGTSHRSVAIRAAEMLGRSLEQLNMITCHLGNGCSMTAVAAGRSVDTSMGLTPLEGLMMGTRCGDIDPAISFFLAERGFTLQRLNELYNKQSGLLGVSGVSNDLRTVTQRASAGDQRAGLALDMFSYRIKKYLGAYTAVLGHVDAVVFTGGIGQHSAEVRAAACAGLETLGIRLDLQRNRRLSEGEGSVSHADSSVQVLVVPTDEEGIIAADTYEVAARDA